MGARSHLPAAAGYAALVAAYFWPVVRHFGSRTVLRDGDSGTFAWAWWHMSKAALRLENPFVTTDLFHPVGVNLALHASTPLEMALAWPVSRLFGLGVAFNVVELAAAFLSALGAYLLAVHVCGDRRAAFVAGAAFALVPYRFVHAGSHFNLIHVEFLPFGLLALLRLLDRPTRGRAVVLGAVVGLTFLTDVNLTVFLLVALVVLAVARRDDLRHAGMGRRLAEAGAVALVLAVPLLVAVVGAVAAGELDPVPGWGGADVRSADLLSWIVPPETHPWWGSAFADVRGRLTGGREGLAYPGLAVLGLAVAAHRLVDRERRRGWVAVAVAGAVLALGPFLQVAGAAGGPFRYLGRSFALPLPYLAFHAAPVLNSIRVPGRFAIVAVLALDVLAALALAGLIRRRPDRARLIVAVAMVVILVEFLPSPVRTTPSEVAAPYHRIAADPGQGAVLEVPLQWQSGVSFVGDRVTGRDDTIFMYYATVHGKPLVSGYVSRYPAERLARLTATPLYRQILALGREPGYDDPATFDAAALRRQGIGYVVYHRDRPWPDAFTYLSGLGLPVLADDGTIVVWKVGP